MNRRHAKRLVNSWAIAVVWVVSLQAYSAEPLENPVSYDRQIRPILAEKCFACHGFDSSAREADLRLDTRQGAIESGSGDGIVPGKPDESGLVHRVESPDVDSVMPPPSSGKALDETEKSLIRLWIAQGAEYQEHWAFILPKQAPPPTTSANEPGHPIDRFLQAKLHEAGLVPSQQAEPETLLRRLSLDLTGLPPTVSEIEDFLAAWKQSPEGAIRAAVERLLASPHYGERFARWWLDQARYADSNGYSIDSPRQIWLYRDWVIEALNKDMAFDEFTIKQFAGDLLPDATDSDRVATGFHRNTQINEEGGIDKEQFRIESIFDRVATTGTVWLGLSIGCAQCHDHKYDPITQRDYYQLFAFLNNQDEPTLKIDETRSTLVLKERKKPRDSHVLTQGDFTRPADQVQPGTPEILHDFQCDSELPNRLDLARWLVDPSNPLTARVIVNRLWQHYFGRGLVESENDFGLQGSTPSHPELLDWLAVEFIESGWSVKAMHRRIVTSHAYQQSSHLREDLSEKDPNNILLGRQSRLRLDAELVRDVALVASGTLAPELGGPPVFPPIPDGVMTLGQVKRQWKTSEGRDRYRRGLYTFVYRATPPPSLSVFDAPEGFQTCTRRIRSNTPLQALTLMNDAAFFEFAQALAGVIDEHGLIEAFRRCTSRYPSESELSVLEKLDSLTAARVLLNLDETISRE